LVTLTEFCSSKGASSTKLPILPFLNNSVARNGRFPTLRAVKRTLLFALAFITALALAGCEKKPPAEEPTPPPESPAPAAQSPAPAEESSAPVMETPRQVDETPVPSPEQTPTPPAEEGPEAAVGEAPPSPQPSEDSLEMRIGFFAPLSGPQASFGMDALNGATLATEEINLAGGILGHPLTLIIKDTESQPEKTTAVVTDLINTEKVAALIGEITTDRSLVAATLAQSSDIPMITPSATGEEVTSAGDYIFRACYTDSVQAAVMDKFARSLDVKSAAILFDASNPYGTGLMEAFKTDFAQHGGTIVAEEFYHAGDTDFAAQLNAIRDKNPECIFLPSYYGEAALIIRQARQMAIDALFLGTDGWHATGLVEVGGLATNNCYFASHFASEQDPGKAKTFSDAYVAKFQITPLAFAALSYDSVWLVADALKRAGSADPTALRDAIAATRDFPGVTGTVSFDQGRDPKKPVIVIRVQDGKFTYLETSRP
jgi:branched-chain amino acid transport system substrate-binding protein